MQELKITGRLTDLRYVTGITSNDGRDKEWIATIKLETGVLFSVNLPNEKIAKSLGQHYLEPVELILRFGRM